MKLYRRLIFSLILSISAVGAQAAPVAGSGQFVVQDIQVEGLQRISAGTLFNYLPVQTGATIAEKDYPCLLYTSRCV